MDVEAFICAVQERPAIWMSTHPQHKFKNVMKRLWEQIKLLFPEYSVDYLKKKWKSLKDTYRKEVKKIPIPRSGDAAIDIEIKWKYFKLLTFLRDEVIATVGDSNLENDDDALTQEPFSDNENTVQDATATAMQPTSDQENTNNLIQTVNENPFAIQTISNEPQPLRLSLPSPSTSTSIDCTDTETLIEAQPMRSPLSSSSSTPIVTPAKKRRTPNDIRNEYLEIEKKKLRMMEMEFSKSNTQTEQKSEDYHFLMSLLPQMEKLPPIQKLRLRNKFNQALLDEIETVTYGYGTYGGYNTGLGSGYNT